MSNWRGAMREAGERDEQDHLSADEAQSMRRVVLAAVVDDARERAAASRWMRRPALVAATIVAIISVGVVMGLRLDLVNRSQQPSTTPLANQAPPIEATGAATPPSNRQLQFMTAGGTRIIWVFNSELDLKATLR